MSHPRFLKTSLRTPALTALLFAATGLGTSCSMKRNLDEMHDTTMDMGGNMKGMKKTTEHMSDTTDEMKGSTCVMYRSLRQGNSKASRDQDFRDIANAKDITGKLAEAAELMQGFEYQVWSPTCADEMSRDEIIEMAMKDLLAKMEAYVKDRSDVNAFTLSKDKETLQALAGTLHYVNSLQGNLLENTQYKVLRPFDILVQGLAFDRRRNRGEVGTESVPAWAEIVGKYEKNAVYLLRLRQNFMMGYAYALADSDNFGNKPGLFSEGKRVVSTNWQNKLWTPNFKLLADGDRVRTPSEIDQRITFALNLVGETNEALMGLGLDPMMDPIMANVWAHADFSAYDPTKLAATDPVFAKSIQGLIQARNRVVTDFKKSIRKK